MQASICVGTLASMDCKWHASALRSAHMQSKEHLDAGLQRRLRKSIVGAIMSTDMAKHFEHCQAFNQHPPTGGRRGGDVFLKIVRPMLKKKGR
eukprot:1158785-Pelagomonas_calceolata.AAC.2